MAGRRTNFTYIIEDTEDHPDKDNVDDLLNDDFDMFNGRPVSQDGDRSHEEPVSTSMTVPLEDDELEEDSAYPDDMTVIDNLLALKQFEEMRKSKMISNTNEAWDLYHNRYDFGHKQEWQSKIATPKFSVAVERIVSSLLRMLEDSDSWFDIKATEPESEIYYNLVEELIKKFLDTEDLRFRQFFKEAVKTLALSQHVFVHVSAYAKGYKTIEQPDTSAGNLFSTGAEETEPGLETLMGGKPPEPEGPDPTTILPSKDNFHINFDTLNTDYCYKDSRNRDLHIITESYYSNGELKMEARERGWDMDKVEQAIIAGDSESVRVGRDGISHSVRDAEKADVTPASQYGRESKVTYFYGTLLEETSGDVVLEDHFFIMVNDCEIVYGPAPMNEVFWGGVRPVAESPFIPVPHAAYGKSPLVDAVPLFVAWNEFYNLMYDYYRMVILGIKEIDMSMIDEAEFDIADGVFPGQAIPVDTRTNPQGQAIKNVQFTDPPAGFFNFVQMFEKDLQDNIALSDTISGGARTRGRITALEHQRRAADAGALIESFYETLEENLLVEVIYKTFYTILQFMPDKDWKDFVQTRFRSLAPKDPKRQEQWIKVFEDLAEWDAKKRWTELAGKFKFKVRVFSALADRQMQIEKATFMLQTVSQIPAAAQHIKQYKLLKHIVQGFGWNADEILSEEAMPLPNVPVDGKLQQSGEEGEGPIEKGASMGAPTSLSTGPPGFPGNSGVPGVRNQGQIADNQLG